MKWIIILTFFFISSLIFSEGQSENDIRSQTEVHSFDFPYKINQEIGEYKILYTIIFSEQHIEVIPEALWNFEQKEEITWYHIGYSDFLAKDNTKTTKEVWMLCPTEVTAPQFDWYCNITIPVFHIFQENGQLLFDEQMRETLFFMECGECGDGYNDATDCESPPDHWPRRWKDLSKIKKQPLVNTRPPIAKQVFYKNLNNDFQGLPHEVYSIYPIIISVKQQMVEIIPIHRYPIDGIY
jgi:hypothetical protein